ncbi:MAG: hypothetical protein JETT_3233 [Candidatus Jettenia ecosi]|uniref:Uncharacterized protein n=1 Tax=Candidatus Jettenia ecosi TaxID=2494326 RepID=A0A533Q8H8_9BACT|nr:MAG: hypothetical protein JETT_3233 [Candidatus Jettenia ecosi]
MFHRSSQGIGFFVPLIGTEYIQRHLSGLHVAESISCWRDINNRHHHT